MTFPNLETLFGTSTSTTNGSSHSILTPTTNATIINGNKIVVRPVISNPKLNKNTTLARIQQITKFPDHPSTESNNKGVCSTITGGNGNLVLYSSNICNSTRSLINNVNYVINNNSSSVKHALEPIVLKPKADELLTTNDRIKSKSSSNATLTDTASKILWKRAKFNNNTCTQPSTDAKCHITTVKIEDPEQIQVSINPKSMFFTQSNVQKMSVPPIHNKQLTSSNVKSTNDQINTDNGTQNQQSTNKTATRFVGIVNRLNSYHNETVRYSFL